MNRAELIEDLTYRLSCARQPGYVDLEDIHVKADDALLAYINDPEITELFHSIPKWYA